MLVCWYSIDFSIHLPLQEMYIDTRLDYDQLLVLHFDQLQGTHLLHLILSFNTQYAKKTFLNNIGKTLNETCVR